jgi:hypothetical protein
MLTETRAWINRCHHSDEEEQQEQLMITNTDQKTAIIIFHNIMYGIETLKEYYESFHNDGKLIKPSYNMIHILEHPFNDDSEDNESLEDIPQTIESPEDIYALPRFSGKSKEDRQDLEKQYSSFHNDSMPYISKPSIYASTTYSSAGGVGSLNSSTIKSQSQVTEAVYDLY